MKSTPFITISPLDNVSVVTAETIGNADVKIPLGHKIALTDINAGENIIKYGQPIGYAINDIKKGDHVHLHNMKTNLNDIIEYTYTPDESLINTDHTDKNSLFFNGFKRKDGKVGIRNEVWIIPTVGCINSTANQLAATAQNLYSNKVDGVFAYNHNLGCSQLGDDLINTQNILKGIIENPNAGAVLVLSLGCENNNLSEFIPFLGDYDPDRIKFLITQDVDDELEVGMSMIDELVNFAAQSKREPVPASELVVGLKCGGSDAFSGITANVLCGRFTDFITGQGGSAILTEVPEMFGAEKLLMSRAADEKVFHKIVSLINNYKSYFKKYNQTIYENPSPGNKKGGISSLEDKSLGCVQKGGKAIIVDVLNYGEHVKTNGLNLLNGSGNDLVSCTNLVSSGAQLILFTTGLGNPFGAPVPTIKISSNSNLYAHKKSWIDYNAGKLIEGKTIEEETKDFINYILDVASGLQTQNEINNYRDISIFKDGVIL